MKITQKLLDDWSGPDGYSDFARGDYIILPAGCGSFHIFQKDRDRGAVEATNKGFRGATRTIPLWIDGIKKPCPRIMPEPEFDLEEIERAERLVHE